MAAATLDADVASMFWLLFYDILVNCGVSWCHYIYRYKEPSTFETKTASSAAGAVLPAMVEPGSFIVMPQPQHMLLPLVCVGVCGCVGACVCVCVFAGAWNTRPREKIVIGSSLEACT